MSNFRHRLREAVKVLATSPASLKDRIRYACANHLLFANVTEDKAIPIYFRNKVDRLLKSVSTKGWGADIEMDKIGATLHGKHGKTLSKIANQIWALHNEFENYLRTGFIPENDHQQSD